MYEKARYYIDNEGVIYRTGGVGYHKNTGEHLIVMRDISNGNLWCIPASDVNDRRSVDGKIVYKYRRCDEEGNDFINDNSEYDTTDSDRNGRHKCAYPGCTNDPRLVVSPEPVVRNRREMQQYRNSHGRY